MTTTAKQLAAEAVRPQERVAFALDDLPITVCTWHILVAPVRPKKESEGGIAIPEEAQRAEDHLISIGKVLEMGALAYKAVTPSKLDLSTDPNAPRVGDFVLYDQYAGTSIVTRDGRRLVILTDTEIKGVVPPHWVPQVKFYL